MGNGDGVATAQGFAIFADGPFVKYNQFKSSLRQRILNVFKNRSLSVFDIGEHRPLAPAKAGGRKH